MTCIRMLTWAGLGEHQWADVLVFFDLIIRWGAFYILNRALIFVKKITKQKRPKPIKMTWNLKPHTGGLGGIRDMSIFHLLSRLLMSWANNTDVTMFTLLPGDSDLWHRLEEYLPDMAPVNTIIRHWQRKVIKQLTCKLPWWIVAWGATRWITLLQPLFTYSQHGRKSALLVVVPVQQTKTKIQYVSSPDQETIFWAAGAHK